MATSGSTNFTLNCLEAIKAAMRKYGGYGQGQSLSPDETSYAKETLNVMLKAMQADGLKLWLRKRATVLLQLNKSSYTIGTDHVTYSYTRTAISTNALAAATSLVVTSTTGMVAGNYIGIVLNTGDSFWTTISSVTNANTVVIAAGLPSAADATKYVYFYATKIDRPLRIIDSFVRDSSSNDIQVQAIAQNTYWNLPNKSSSGKVNQIYYDSQLTGVLYVWPQSNTVTDTLELVVQRPVEDLDNTTDNFDCPVEWLEPIIDGLAWRLAKEDVVDMARIQMLKADAMESLYKAMSFDIENTSVFFQPNG